MSNAESKKCFNCKKELGLLSGKVQLKDGYVCKKCLSSACIPSIPSKYARISDLSNLPARIEAVKNFRAQKKYNDLIIDTRERCFKINHRLFFFHELLSYEYLEDPVHNSNMMSMKSTAVGATVGGLIGGAMGKSLSKSAIGAAVGGVIGNLFSSSCNSMKIVIHLKDAFMPSVELNLITEKTKTNSDEYAESLKKAKIYIEGLKLISEFNRSNARTQNQDVRVTEKIYTREVLIQEKHISASEIEKELEVYKRLLYSGDITEEEFNQKKMQLLELR